MSDYLYQFRVDGRSFGSLKRETWHEAAQDAVNAGFAVWAGSGSVRIDDQARIVRIPRVALVPASQTQLATGAVTK